MRTILHSHSHTKGVSCIDNKGGQHKGKIDTNLILHNPNLEVLHKEQAYTKTVLKKDPNLSTLDGLVHLAVETTIQHKSLDIALENWDAALKILLEVNNTFLAKYGITS